MTLLLGGSHHRALIKISLSTRSVESLQICRRLVLFGSVAHYLRVLNKSCVDCLLDFRQDTWVLGTALYFFARAFLAFVHGVGA